MNIGERDEVSAAGILRRRTHSETMLFTTVILSAAP
jgi:hypothetical protein